MTSTAVLVTGATGNVGHEVVLELASARVRVRAASTDPARARALLGSDIEILPFAFGRPETYRAAFEGMDGLFLMRPPDVTDVRRLINPALQVAIEAGVHQVVFLSLQGVERNPVVPHRSIERALLDSGLTYTFLRASFFMQNLSTTHAADIRERDEVFVPAGGGRTAFVDVRDLAAVAALAFARPEHANKAYELTGSEALTYTQVAAILSEVLGRPIRYADPSAPRFWRRMRQRNYPAAQVLVMIGLYTVCRLGLAGHLSDTLAKVLDRPPTTFSQFARDYASVWRR